MEHWPWKKLAELIALPPHGLVALYILGWWVGRHRRRLGRAMRIAALLALYLLATPFVATPLLASLEGAPLDPAELAHLDHAAIVVLSGNFELAPEYGGPTPGSLTIARMRYAARLHRASNLPVLASGGVSDPSYAAIMRASFAEDFEIPVKWLEERSRDTAENAAYSAAILKADGVATVVLVTNAWHMPRAAYAFTRAGMRVVPAPTGFVEEGPLDATAFLPSPGGLADSYYAIHEWVGFIWYRMVL